MERGLYIAATGMLSDIARQDVIAANLANASTVGYKSDRVVNETFSELFLNNLKNERPVGPLNMGTRVSSIVTDFSQGSMRNTGSPLDVAIAGDGFFSVQTPTGTSYSRAGQFQKTADGVLVDARGNYVLNTLKQPIRVGDGDPAITADGRVFVDNKLVGQMRVVTLDVQNARKVGENLWQGKETAAMPVGSQVRQGFLEASGVSSVSEMVEMIKTLRSYESAQRAITAIDGTLDKAVNNVGTL